ncbi:MAG TPA: carbamoyltransferase [Candidatus Polarisedimenticolia bacterium]|nr:carbamoyltransferase [Candidatus Polarisedimenticolia bacterium]
MHVLGLNYYDHDSAAVLLRDGRIVAAVAEERLSRRKKDNAFPRLAIRHCLDRAGIAFGDLDHVAFGWQRPGASFQHDLGCMLRGRIPIASDYFVQSARRMIRERHQHGGLRIMEREFGRPRGEVLFVDHHFSHVMSSYLMSGFDKAAVLILDGRGAWESTTLWSAAGDAIDLVESYPYPNSLGMAYAAFTEYLGFRPNSDEWKVMGLAPYGKPGVDIADFLHLNGTRYTVDHRKVMGRHSRDRSRLVARFGPQRAPESDLDDRHKDIAWAIQDACERAMIHLSRGLLERTGTRKLCLSGGVALNSKANGAILASGMVDDIFIQPAATDDGAALGAALGVYARLGMPLPRQTMDHVYLGPDYSDEEIERVLKTFKLTYSRPADVAVEAARALSQGKIVGWFQGRMEFGPRALGNRSILADPRDPEMKDRVNAVVKFREGWRPFAPSVTEERGGDYFEGFKPSPFMILTFQVRPGKREVIPAVTHVDGSARVQSVRRDVNPRYHQLITAFGEITGVHVVMNTSYNLREEPIVCSPQDAVRTFFSSGLDMLCLGPFMIVK